MKTLVKKLSAALVLTALLALFAVPFTAYAVQADGASVNDETSVAQTADAEEVEDSSTGTKAIAAAVAIAIVAAAGAVSMGIAISKSSDSISRQPEVADKIRTSLTLGLVFIETAIIYALIVAILIIFVL